MSVCLFVGLCNNGRFVVKVVSCVVCHIFCRLCRNSLQPLLKCVDESWGDIPKSRVSCGSKSSAVLSTYTHE